MRSPAIKLFLAVLAAILTFGVVAFAAATTGSDQPSPKPSNSVAPASLAPTSAPEDVAETAAPVSTSDPVTGVPGAELPEDSVTGESPNERTTAVNPAGHCVDLPASSNVIAHPDKHPNWTIEPCEPDGDATPPDGEEPEDNREKPDGEQQEGGGPLEGRTPALNPNGVCIEMPNNSDIVQHPEKHQDWSVAGCSTSVNDQ